MAEAGASELRRVLAANVRQLRKAQGLSQDAFADECGVHRTYVGGVERGEYNVSVDNIEKFAKALGVQGFELLKP
jgi:transcriptional regulator with XRE-family HTH domain